MDRKTYLMIAGTFLPAFAATSIRVAIKNKAKLDTWDILIFATAAAFGGFYTAKILKEHSK